MAATDYHHIVYLDLEVANPVRLETIEAFAARAELAPGARVLDIGAGTGGVGVALARRYGYDLHAIERDPAMVRAIGDRLRGKGASARVSIVAEHSNDALDRLAPADMIIALGSTEAAGRGIKTPDGIIGGLAARLKSPGYILWGDLVWTAKPPEPLRQVVGVSGVYASDAGWKQAAAAAGLETVCSELSPQALWDEFFGGVDARARTWLDANPRSPSFENVKRRADQVTAIFGFGRPFLGFGLYLFRKP